MADEKRLHERTNLDTKLTLYVLGGSNARDMDSFDVEITDASATGIGFRTDKQLMIGEMFKGVLQIWTKQKLDVILKIVRSAVEEEDYSYGSIFIGMTENDSKAIEIYQMVNNKKR